MNIRVKFARRLLLRYASGSLPFWIAYLTRALKRKGGETARALLGDA